MNINEIRLIVRGEQNVYIKVADVLIGSPYNELKRNKNLVYVMTLFKGISFIIPLATIGLISHGNLLMLTWTAFALIYTGLTMFKVLDVLDGDTNNIQNKFVYMMFVYGNIVFVTNFILGRFI
ncbi:hypothetical protein [Bacillus atrophaeus]|uniref:Uncharacterized protein n=1 Tax=Bacillus atrophaeus (strain 1942) TaxID=720555 RepID=A0ABN3Z939_BACA1|nr:hypothetical protein [Bacillus atrophaeus]AMR64723.1 hypothetical protein A1D11_09930 [Bacillus subtilis subsp. globigii]ADP32435.1 hypothetical protein BATR1942_07435 [Bacillus atrophaeus 1942]EIM11766.1 hypothetical protein UY9_05922 [Bacillus atrophaeus C89]MBG9762186.1 hypothetical protein [Bacillus atrophaeus]MCM3457510.1 hypothetical protein [Bacillus atrophaeus]